MQINKYNISSMQNYKQYKRHTLESQVHLHYRIFLMNDQPLKTHEGQNLLCFERNELNY